MSLAFLGCDNGSSNSSNSDNISFRGAGVSRQVSLNSDYGGVTYGYGTFYEGSMKLVSGSTTFSVLKSDRSNWNYMVKFNDGSAWYFD